MRWTRAAWCGALVALSMVADTVGAEGEDTRAPALTPPDPKTACTGCHASLAARAYVHGATRDRCTECHAPEPGASGTCGSDVAGAWRLSASPAQLCARCHPADAVAGALAVKHAPAADGRCVACHDPHSSDRRHLVRDEPRKLCLRCHGGIRTGGAAVDRGATAHAPFESGCEECHEGPHGGARAKLLRQDLPDLCYRCHARKDQKKTVHAALSMGTCVDCHAAHTSDERPLLKQRIERLCADCHDLETLAPKPYRHAATSAQCGACHDAHSSDEPKLVRTASSTLCLACHDASAPTGRGAAGGRSRVDLRRKNVHRALERTTCLGCHDGGHSSERPRLLRARVPDLCYGCHSRKDGGPYVHGAVLTGRCDGCHEPHSSDFPKLARKADPRATCFSCHDGEVLSRKVVHPPFAEGCAGCHAPHSAGAAMLLTMGRGDETCRACHPDVGTKGKRHAALVRYGCTACHDPHAASSRALLPRETSALCVTCHPDERDGAHAMSGTGKEHPMSGGRDPRRTGREMSCTSCHDPHAAEGPTLLRSGGTVAASCASCHAAESTGDRTLTVPPPSPRGPAS